MSLTADLTANIRAKPISGDDRHVAALYFLDAVGSAFAGRKTDAGKLFLQWSRSQGNDAGRAAFTVAGLTHIVETDDLHRASVTHPGCVVVPTVLALACQPGALATAALDAVLHGFEAMCRIGMAVGSEHYKIWHNTATCGPYGAAMATATLLGLPDKQCVHALGNAGTQSSGLWQFLDSGAMSKHLHAARAAESGIVAAQLAALGFTGPEEILEGEKGFFAATCPNPAPQQLTILPQDPWQLRQTSIKPWPSCRHTHAPIDAALSLGAKVDVQEIRKIEVESYQAALDLCNRPKPDSAYTAKFSLQHTVAIALLNGNVSLRSFDAAARQETEGLRNLISVNGIEPWLSNYP